MSGRFRRGCTPPPGRLAGWAVGLLAVVCSAPLVAQTPAGTAIPNRAVATFVTANGSADSATSNTIVVVVGRAGAITLAPPDSATADPGDTLVFRHTLTNGQNADDAFTASATSLLGWPVSLFRDVNADGRLDPGDVPWTGAQPVPAAATASLLMVVQVPDTAAVRGQRDSLTVRAFSTGDTAVNAAVPDVVAVRGLATLELEKLLETSGPVRRGDRIAYRLAYRNTSATEAARDVVLTDTLPASVVFESATPAAQVTGAVVAWSLGDIAPGASGEIRLTVRVAYGGPDSLMIGNVAVMAGSNTGTASAAASPIAVVNGVVALDLTKTANVLETSLGEVVPYTLVSENTGSVPLAGVTVRDRLPEGGRYVPGSAVGVDSAIARNAEVVFYLGGVVAPGERRMVRYQMAVVSAERDVLQNTAVATAEGDDVRSAEAVAWVRVRPGYPMETRAVIGKVWADLDGDGVQDSDEPGVEAADVFTIDGEIVTTDREGRFSFRNMRTGRQVYRLDATSLPLEYGVADDATSDLALRDATGWTTPRVVFRVVPRVARLTAARLPVLWQFLARPALARHDTVRAAGCADEWPVGTPAVVEPVVLRGVSFAFDRADLTADSRFVLDEVASTLARHPAIRVEVAGHTDGQGPPPYNRWLSEQRASAVRRYLAGRGVELERLAFRGYGLDQPVATNATRAGRAANRRVELRVMEPEAGAAAGDAARDALRNAVSAACALAAAEYATPLLTVYELRIENPYTTPLANLSLDFGPAADSVRIVVEAGADTVLHRSGVSLPPVPAGGRLRVRAWAHATGDSATAVLRGAGLEERLTAEVHNPVRPVNGHGTLRLVSAGLPAPDQLPAGTDVEAVLFETGLARDAAWAVPTGWTADPASARDTGGASAGAMLTTDRRGAPALTWRATPGAARTVLVTLRPAGDVAPLLDSAAVRVGLARSEDDRAADRRRALTSGPGVAFFAPDDGAVVASDRLFVGVKGEPGAPITLYDGDSVLSEATLRADGVYDGIGVRLAHGPHRLHARMRNSWRQERWDSIAVHVSGPPAGFGWEGEPIRITADGRSETAVEVRVVDAWGVPVKNRPLVTVAADGAEVTSPDADASSVGIQVAPGAAGWLRVTLRAGVDARRGTLTLRAGEATGEVPLELLPPLVPLTLTGVGRVGVGAAGESFGAVVARGGLDARTSLVMTYDSRGLDAGRDVFDRASDPLEAAQYPVLGDAGTQRTLAASRGGFAARVERGFDWLAAGDVLATGFAGDLALARYGRALTGVAGRLTTGPLTWQGFGASTSRQVRQTQLRGAGHAGPYRLTTDLAPGTEIVMLETRALENAERVVTRQALLRYVDYQVDYASGALLFKRPVPASDAYGNPVFIVVTYEADGGGDAAAVWGLRAMGRGPGLDSLVLGATFVHDGAAVTGAYTLGGGDLSLQHGGLTITGELAATRSRDSSGIGTMLAGSFRVGPGVEVTGRWMHLGAGFHNPATVALRGGTDEAAVGARALLAGNELKLEHAWQRFAADDVSRSQTRGTVARTLAPGLRARIGASVDRMTGAAGATGSQAGEWELAWDPTGALRLWAEGRHLLGTDGTVAIPSHAGIGARYQLTPALALEARHREAFLGDTVRYGVTNVGLRTRLGGSTEAWGAYQLAGVSGAHGAAVVGLNSRMRVGRDWTVSGMLERRMGLGRAAIEDPARALPFVQDEEDYWALGLGAELLPQARNHRASLRVEGREGDLRSTRLLSAAGAVSITPALAVLSRQEFLRDDVDLATGPRQSRRLWSLWGAALRPTRSDRWNLLAKVEWLDVRNPQGGGVLTSQGDEARMIVTGEAIYEASARTEVGARYAVRRARATLRYEDGFVQDLWSFAHFAGWRAQHDWRYGFGLRADARGLYEQTSGTFRYDAAPQLVLDPIPGLEFAGGYRFGTLRDPDFAVSGGAGFFLTVEARVTERSLASAADFWFDRLGRKE